MKVANALSTCAVQAIVNSRLINTGSGAVQIADSKMQVVGSTFDSNFGTMAGALSIQGQSSVLIDSTSISNNTATAGGALVVSNHTNLLSTSICTQSAPPNNAFFGIEASKESFHRESTGPQCISRKARSSRKLAKSKAEILLSPGPRGASGHHQLELRRQRQQQQPGRSHFQHRWHFGRCRVHICGKCRIPRGCYLSGGWPAFSEHHPHDPEPSHLYGRLHLLHQHKALCLQLHLHQQCSQCASPCAQSPHNFLCVAHMTFSKAWTTLRQLWAMQKHWEEPLLRTLPTLPS